MSLAKFLLESFAIRIDDSDKTRASQWFFFTIEIFLILIAI